MPDNQTIEAKPSRDWRDKLLLDILDTLTRLLVYRDEDAAREHLEMAKRRLMSAWEKPA